MQNLPIDQGTWLNQPADAQLTDEQFTVTTRDQSDCWRTTSYGFVHESGHALLRDFAQASAIEVSWLLDYDQQFDQAGLMAWSDPHHYIKAGVEFADGEPPPGAVVTNEISDWSVAPVPHWVGKVVTLRFSRSGDALTIRAKADGEFKRVRLAPLDPAKYLRVGLQCASPPRAGLKVTFTDLKVGPADAALH